MAWFVIMRPLNGLLALLSLWVATYLASESALIQVRSSLALFLLISFGYIINDIFDRKLDAIGKPKRVLPSGRLTTQRAVVLAASCLVLSLGLAAWVSTAVLFYVGVVALLLFHYAFSLSGMPLAGNIMVALICSSVFYLGGMIAEPDDRGWQLLFAAMLFSFLHHLAREIVKDFEDSEADKAAGRKTLPVAWGRRAAVVCAGMVLLLLIGSTYFLYDRFALGTPFLLLVSFGVNLPLLVAFILFVLPRQSRRLDWASMVYKVTMLPGLAALVLARL